MSEAGLIGTEVANRYSLVRLLGDGGMGAVYKAADPVLRRFVAIKLLHSSVAQNPASVERFQREARAAAAIGHPNIIDILDFGYENTSPYLVMEYLRGESLSYVIARSGALPIESAVVVACHTLSGLSAAHSRGILHRDLKPANLMLVPLFGDRHFVKICDFGFAALLRAGNPALSKSLTPERTLVGTPAYAAPERLRGDDRRDPRIDVYSVGVVLYEMLAARRPFDAPTFAELARKVKHDPPPPLRKYRSDIPVDLENVVMKALSKKPEDRYVDAREFAKALIPWGGRLMTEGDRSMSDSFTMEMERLRSRDARRSGKLAPQTNFAMNAGPQPRVQPQGAGPRAGRVDAHLDSSKQEPLSAPRIATELVAAVRTVLVQAACVKLAETHNQKAIDDALLAAGANSLVRLTERSETESEWSPMSIVDRALTEVDRRLGADDLLLIVDGGRGAARILVDWLKSNHPSGLPKARIVLTELPLLFRNAFTGADIRIERWGNGHARFEVSEHTPLSLGITSFLLGIFEGFFHGAGAKEVEVNLVGAKALDDERTLVDVTWLE